MQVRAPGFTICCDTAVRYSLPDVTRHVDEASILFALYRTFEKRRRDYNNIHAHARARAMDFYRRVYCRFYRV